MALAEKMETVASTTHVEHSYSASHGSHHEPEDPSRPYRPLLRRLRVLLRPEMPDVWAVVIYGVWIGILNLATPLTVEALVNSVAFGGLVQPVVVLSVILFICLGIAAGLRGLQNWVVEVIQRRLFLRVAGDLAHRLPRVPIREFDDSNGPELVNRFFDILTVQKVSATMLLDGLGLVLSATIGLVVLALYHPFLFGYDIALLALITFAILYLGRGGVQTSVEESAAKYRVQASLETLALRPGIFKSFGGLEMAETLVNRRAKEWLRARQRHFRVLIWQISFALGMQAAAATALLCLGGFLVVRGQLSLGQLIAAELIVTTIVGSVAKMGKHLDAYYDLLAAVSKLGHLLDLPLERAGGEDLPPSAKPAAILVRDLSIDLGGQTIFQSASLAIAPGERIALLGTCGAGRTTFLEVLAGLRSPSSGSVRIDGVDLRSLEISSYRRQVAAIFEPEVFEATIAENLRLGREHVSSQAMHAALAPFDLLDEILKLPLGLQTPLTMRGSPLSRNQIIRLAMVRATCDSPRLLLLDGTLDLLGHPQREQVAEVLLRQGAPWTTVLVTHDPRVAARCDRQIEIRDCQLTELPTG